MSDAAARDSGAPEVAEDPALDAIAPRVRGAVSWAVIGLSAIGVFLAMNLVFVFPLGRFQPPGNATLYWLIALFLSVAFLTMPARPADAGRVRWYDLALVAATLGSAGWLALHALEMIEQGWEFEAPPTAQVASTILVLVVLEGVRRAGGWTLLAIALVFGAWPLFADHMPGFLWGSQFGLAETLRLHAIGNESITGIPMRVVADLVIGFVLFGAVLTVTGGGDFFMTFATALMGRRRGGPAKVAVVSSAIMGSLSGSVISNVLTTGRVTIPTMIRSGYPPHYAAAIEGCASTGGTLMPPVMGAVAFIMASFLNVPYADIMIAALLPALLFYVALLFQVDCFAARRGLSGMATDALPGIWDAVREGWPYLLSLGALVWFLLGWRIERQAPYYAGAIMIAACIAMPGRRFGLAELRALLLEIGHSVGQLVAILAGIGLVVGGLSYTGVAGAFSRELLLLAGDSVPLMLVAGAVTSFVLGMGMTVSACYIFLSILLAPALVQSGLDPIGSHLFILYWGMLSYITPPVALAAITAAGVAGAPAMASGVTAMRIGGVLFLLPFMFVLDPALLLHGSVASILLAAITAITAMWSLACASEGWLHGVGRIGWGVRAGLLVAGLAMMVPEWRSDLAGLAILIAVFGAGRFGLQPA